MRVVVVGPAAERARLRDELVAADIDVVGEVETMAEARAGRRRADAIVLAVEPSSREPAASVDEPPLVETLTPRELEVLGLLAEGMANKAIASRLGISDETVKFHVGAIYGKLGASNRTDAVRRAFRRGIITL
jgi:DNA-binding NarL/FixJ family response regulator